MNFILGTFSESIPIVLSKKVVSSCFIISVHIEHGFNDENISDSGKSGGGDYYTCFQPYRK